MICSSDCGNYRLGIDAWFRFDTSSRLVGVVIVSRCRGVVGTGVVRLALWENTRNLMPTSFRLPSFFVLKSLANVPLIAPKRKLTPRAGVSSLLEAASLSLSSAGCSSAASGSTTGSEMKRQMRAGGDFDSVVQSTH